MKIDKIVFSSSVDYSPFWNIQAKVWKTKFGIEPVCLLFGGSKKNCGMSEEHGTVHEIPFDPSLPSIIQLQFYKFFFPSTEPDKIWMIGDIDLLPLQTKHFFEGLSNVSDAAYCHFNHSSPAQNHGLSLSNCVDDKGIPLFLKRGGFTTGGYDLPANYHAAKGKMMGELFFPSHDFNSTLKEIIESKRYGMGEKWDGQINDIHGNNWLAEEAYTSERIFFGYKRGAFTEFYGKQYDSTHQHISWHGRLADQNGRWTPQWTGTDYIYDVNRLKNNGYVDIHCWKGKRWAESGPPRVIEGYKEQEIAMMRILEQAGMI
jgi:hypothetical protein